MTHIHSLMLVAAMALPLITAPAQTAFAFDGDTASSETKAKADPFQPTDHIMADVDAVLARAAAKGKLGLIIMGGNWCHDSRALVKRMDTPELSPILDASYETLLVDVAGLSDNMNVAKRFGRPVIYGTPTVLIIDPATGKLVNAHDMHQWRDAESISLEDTTDYFARMANTETRGTPPELVGNAQYAALTAGIDAFEKTQAERIYGAFAVVGPMLMMPKSERPETFGKLWMELSKFRYQITKDLAALDAEARALAAAGDNSASLTYPTYTPFSWE